MGALNGADGNYVSTRIAIALGSALRSFIVVGTSKVGLPLSFVVWGYYF